MYIIKKTYTDGQHKGNVHYIRKGGFPTDCPVKCMDDELYDSLSVAKRVSTQRNNEAKYQLKIYCLGHKLHKYAIDNYSVFYEPCEVR